MFQRRNCKHNIEKPHEILVVIDHGGVELNIENKSKEGQPKMKTIKKTEFLEQMNQHELTRM